MKPTEAFTQLVDSLKQLLSKCYDALDPNADQATRDKLREALREYLGKGDEKPSA